MSLVHRREVLDKCSRGMSIAAVGSRYDENGSIIHSGIKVEYKVKEVLSPVLRGRRRVLV
jgi:hypothetical protein